MICPNCKKAMYPIKHMNNYCIGYETEKNSHTVNTVPYICKDCGLVQLYVIDESFLDDLENSITPEYD